MKHFLVTVALAASLLSIPAYAHHSFARFYFEKQTVSITGEVVEFEYRSPHAWVHVMAPDEKGQMQRFAAEWSNPTRLARSRIGKDALKAGDIVTISGSPGRTSGEYKLHLKGIVRPADGWTWGRVQNLR